MAARYTAKDRTAIVGLGLSPYSRDRGATTELSMVLEASIAAIRDAGLAKTDIDGVVGGGLLTGGVDPLTVIAGLGLVLTIYRDIVHAAFFATFVITVGVFAAAIAVPDADENKTQTTER